MTKPDLPGWARFAVSAAALILALGGFTISLCIANHILGASIPSITGIEPQPRLWDEDRYTGYKNKASLHLESFGNIALKTDTAGARAMKKARPQGGSRPLRVVGIGDSVTWGVFVDAEDTFLGVLPGLARERGMKVDAINAGVVGYSTFQSRIFFEKYVLPMKPDVVLLNFCSNDWVPSEDPFRNLVDILQAYLSSLLTESTRPLSSREKEAIGSTLRDYRKLVNMRGASSDFKRGMFRPLIGIPMLELADLAKARGIRFIVLLIPPAMPDAGELETAAALRRLLDENGVESIDLSSALSEDKSRYSPRSPLPLIAMMRRLLHVESLGDLSPALAAERFSRIIRFKMAHRRRNFMDSSGHLSRKGHRIVAMRILPELDRTVDE